MYGFELDHLSGPNAERPNRILTTNSVINLGWGGKQRKMRSSVLSKGDVGKLNHSRRIAIGKTQSVVFLEDDLPPIFDPTATKYDQSIEGESATIKLNKVELKG